MLFRSQFSLGLRQFCRHECTSWHFAIRCIALPGVLRFCIALSGSAFSCPVASWRRASRLPAACPGLDGEYDGWRFNRLRASGKLPRKGTPRATYHDSQKICRHIHRSLAGAPSADPSHLPGPLPSPLPGLKQRGRRFPPVMPFLWELSPCAAW